MARVLHHSHCLPSSANTHINNPPKIIRLSQKSAASLREICGQGTLKQAFNSVSDLLTDQNSTDSYRSSLEEAYGSILDLCAAQKAVFQGQQIHARVVSSGAALDREFLSTKLVFMYGKCGYLPQAQYLFDEMSQKTVFTWNALIGAYASNGRPLGAIELYREIRETGVGVDSCTFPLILKSCGAVQDLDLGTEIHGFAIKSGFVSVVFVINSLVAMYAKCNCISEAMKLFDGMNEKGDVVSWNSIMSALLQHGQYVEVLQLFREMQKIGTSVNSYTVVSVLEACAELSLVKLGMEIHASLLKSGRELHIFEANALVVMYSKAGQMGEAVRVFEKMDEKDKVSWNSMLSSYVQNGFYTEALGFFHDAQRMGHRPDQVSVISIASASGRLGKVLNGMEAHAFAVKHGFDSDLQVANTLIDMYGKCSYVNYAGRIFLKIPTKDFITWTTFIATHAQNSSYFEALQLFREVQREGMKVDSMMIGSILIALSGLKCVSHVKEIHAYVIRHGLFDLVLQNSLLDVYGECGKVKEACRLFEGMVTRDVVSWTSMISCLVHNGFASESLNVFHQMVETGVQSDSVTLVSLLSAVSNLSALRKGKEIHGFVIRHCFVMDGSICSSLVDMYSSCGNVDNAYKVFEGINCKDTVSWTSMINACGMHGRGKEAINLFNRMEETGLAPDHITFLALLYACSHSGLIEEGKRYLEIMKSKHNLEPWPEHYASVVDLLGRSACVNEAYEFIRNMPIAPTTEIWCALLGACRVHSNHEIGEVAAQKLLELDPENPGNYVLASNFFAAKEGWGEVEEIRLTMKKRGLKKSPACSWTEVGNKVHSFVVKDRSHPQTTEIYSKLGEITKKLQTEGGYVADTKYVLHDLSEEEKVKRLSGHSERLAIAFGLINTNKGTPIRITKNLRVCGDCHQFTKLVSKLYEREIVVRDSNRFHHFENGTCSCGDFW
ncbi:pentatricopeptide repeat-containing protein At3g63370, chloroplastic [Aristolochia californica]|uniref:pentatricopeptide repeat-containing protein At3g63370, chloroplastic n=1 Tax=Aristolochia californica TaxID=171875 RepID=UPI0035E11303